jgi:hypothetical protein
MSSVAEYSPDSNDVRTEAGEPPLVEVSRERLMKTQQAGKGLVGAVLFMLSSGLS